jgi:hypothetical protein
MNTFRATDPQTSEERLFDAAKATYSSAVDVVLIACILEESSRALSNSEEILAILEKATSNLDKARERISETRKRAIARQTHEDTLTTN